MAEAVFFPPGAPGFGSDSCGFVLGHVHLFFCRSLSMVFPYARYFCPDSVIAPNPACASKSSRIPPNCLPMFRPTSSNRPISFLSNRGRPCFPM